MNKLIEKIRRKKEKTDQVPLNERLEQELLDNKAMMLALQNQINPHFLYNTLESIRAKALLHDERDIAKMAETLALLFRYSTRKDNSPVTIADEIDCIKNYLTIQNYRFDNKFRLEFKLDEILDVIDIYPMPAMTLQPIVENAVHYGLEVKQDKGTVLIHGFKTETLLVLRIIDDGNGMSKESLRHVRAGLYDQSVHQQTEDDQDNRTRPNGTGIALNNINRRIKLFYGEDYGLNITSAEHSGTMVEISLPLTPADRDTDEKRSTGI